MFERMKNVERCIWKDIMSAILLYFIWVAHLGAGSELLRVFLGNIANCGFFLASGFFAISDFPITITQYIKKCTVSLMLPYLCWAFLNIGFYFFLIDGNVEDLVSGFIMFLNPKPGVMSYAGALWFLVGLWYCKVIYQLMYCILKNKYLICMLCFLIFSIMDYLSKIGYSVLRPAYGLSLYYLFFYSLGVVLYPIFNRLYSRWKNKMYKREYILIMTLLLVGDGFIYFKGGQYIDNMLFTVIKLSWVTVSLIGISFFIDSSFLATVGRNTIILCGSEFMLKSIVPIACDMVNVKFEIKSPVACMLYVAVLFMLAGRFVIPFVRKNCTILTGAPCIIQV